MTNDNYMNEYSPQLSKDDCNKLWELRLFHKLKVDIGSYLSENTYLDEEDAINLVGNAFFQLIDHYYPSHREVENNANKLR